VWTRELEIPPDETWGFDHGAWSVLRHLYPQADVPVFQISLDDRRTLPRHVELGSELARLRDRGVLILGSGNIVHSLRNIQWIGDAEPYDWAVEFDAAIAEFLVHRNHYGLTRYRELLGRDAELSAPTEEHYLPLLYIAALRRESEPLTFFSEGFQYASISMRSLRIG